MLEWNAFVKPILYVLELILGTVVTFGVADKFLFFDKNDVLLCAMASMTSCAIVIAFGSFALILAVLVLRKRLIAAFDDDEHFEHTAEAISCTVLSLFWLIIACILTAKINGSLPSAPRLRGERAVSLTFAWLLWVLYGTSASIAWFVPEKDSEILRTQDSETFDMADSSQLDRDVDDIGLSEDEDIDDDKIHPGPSKEITATRALDQGGAGSSANHASLVRLNARRMSGPAAKDTEVDTSLIDERLAEWNSVILDEAHAEELGRATQIPVPTKSTIPVPRTLFGSALTGDGLRRRNVTFPGKGSIDKNGT